MGTKVQFKSYIPIHNVIRSRNEHSTSSWSWYYQDNVLSDHLFDGSLLREANDYSLCDKEFLKRTILEHEATFTKQVSELHRLYRIQKELMNELKSREKLRLCSTFQANFFTSHMLCKASEELRQMPHLSMLSSHASTVNAMELPLKHLKETGKRYFQMPLETAGFSIEGNSFDPQKKTLSLPRKKFDLHLPAEAYIDNDDDAIMEKHNPSSIAHNLDGDNNVKLSLNSKADGSINGSLRLHMHHENVSSRVVLADLNEPLKPSSYEEGEDLTFPQVIGSKLENEEIIRHQLHSNRSSLSRDFFLGNYGQKQIVSNSVNLDKVECLQEWPSSANAANASGEIRNTANGSHGELCGGEFSVISQLEKEQPKNCDEFVLPGRSKCGTGGTLSPNTETSQYTPKLANLNSSEWAAPLISHPFASFSHLDTSSISSPSISSWRNPNCVKQTTAAQLISSFNGYAVKHCRKANATFQSPPCSPCDNVQYIDGNLKKKAKVVLSSCQNDFHQDLKHSSIFPTQTCLPLIISEKSIQTSCIDNVTLGNYNVPLDSKCSEGFLCAGVEQSLESSLLRKNQAQPDSEDIEQSASQLMNLMPNPNAAASSVNERKKNEKVSTSICSPDSSSTSHVMERNEASCSLSGKRILQFPISESNEQNVECDPSTVDIRNQVNAHSSALCMDALNILPKDELPSSLSTTNISMKIAPTIDLEGLLDTEVEEDITIAGKECKELNCNLVTSNKEDNQKALITEAAGNLVAISLSIGDHSYDITLPSNPTSFYTLNWFADFVTSTEVSTEISEEKSSHDDNVNGLDLFEYETLRLKEVKEHVFFLKQQENQNYDDTSISLLPLTRSQRRPARKRRQRRDFQKDILPGLASLSRHEVSEDLQNFGGIMRASGKSWKTGLSRRSINWKASNGQARGRRRPRSLAITVTEIKIGSSQKEDANSKQEIITTGILGWGRTTRRCRRPRLLPGNLSVSLT